MSSIARTGLGIALSGVLAVGVCLGMPSAAADNPICSEQVCSFYSPTHNLSCEINYQREGIADSAYCQASPPAPVPESVHMDGIGTYSVCPGTGCLGNAGVGQATLPYGESASLGPFTCRSDVEGITCTVVSGCGFLISGAAITKVAKR